MSITPIIETVNLDSSPEAADWIKQAWDLPPYRSAEFFEHIPPERLDWFRNTPVYKYAVENGLIYDDEWVDDWVVNPHEAFADALAEHLIHAEVTKAYDPDEPRDSHGRWGSGDTPKRLEGEDLKAAAAKIKAMSQDERDNTEIGDFPGYSSGYNLYAAQKVAPKPSDKLVRVTPESASFEKSELGQSYDYVANVDGEHFGISKYDDPDAGDDNEDENGNAKDFVYAFQRLDYPNHPMVETDNANKNDLFAAMREYDPKTVKKISKAAIDRDAHRAATSLRNDLPEPTLAQKEAGNYVKGHITIGGIDISIENPVGSKRKPQWPTLRSYYGYIRLTRGADGEQIDCFVRPGTDDAYNGPVYVVDQVNADGSFDEHKVMIGWRSKQKAVAAYLANYKPGWKVGNVTRLDWADFKQWVDEGWHDEPLSE